MFSCFRKSHGSRRTKGKGGLLGRLWGRLVCLVTYLCSSPNMEDQGQMEPDRLFKCLKFDYESPDFIQKVVQYLPTAVKKGKGDFVYTFLTVYPTFATTREVLELIGNMIMYGYPHGYFLEEHNANSILFFLALWMQELPQDFRMSSVRVLLRRLVDYLYQNLPLTFYQLHVQRLMTQLEAQESTEMLEVEEEARDCGFSRATTTVGPVPDTTEMPDAAPEAPSVTGPRGDLRYREETENTDSAVWGPTLPEAGPVQPKPTAADPADVAIALRDAARTAGAVPVVPLPEVDM